MSEQKVAMSEEWAKRNVWYRNYRFSLLPNYRIRPADEHNEWSFYFDWLFLKVWTMMCPDIGFEIELNDQDFYFKLLLPYLIVLFSIPVFPQRWHQKLWRYPRDRYESAS